MKNVQRSLALCALLAAGSAAWAAPSGYAGQESRAIKSLSPEEIDGYRAGKGMGFAKPAELNGVPGPLHVLELADKLGLEPAQREATEALLRAHKSEVSDLGARYVEAERELEVLFASGAVTPEALRAALGKSEALHSRIRESHLATHVKQASLLTPVQIRMYSHLRGYGAGAGAEPHSHRH